MSAELEFRMGKRVLVLGLCAFLVLLLMSCKPPRPFTKDDAILVAQGFVNERVRFFASNGSDEGQEGIASADISILSVYPERDGTWTVLLYVEGESDEGTKRGGLALAIDPQKRQVVNAQAFNPRMNETNVSPQVITSPLG